MIRSGDTAATSGIAPVFIRNVINDRNQNVHLICDETFNFLKILPANVNPEPSE